MQAGEGKGRFISIEGGEGAGKSTVMSAIREALQTRGFEVVATREPGGTVPGEAIRALLLDPNHRLAAETELLLMFAARAQLVRELILPSLARGAVVVSDRFTDASFAYQGGGRGLDMGRIAELERWAAGIKPGLTFLLDVGIDEGLARARSRGGEPDPSARARAFFFQWGGGVTAARAAAEPERFRVIDASQTPGYVVAAVVRAVSDWLEQS